MLIRGITDIYKKEFLFAIQVELENSGNVLSGKYCGFTTLDDGILAIISAIISLRISEFNKTRMYDSKLKEHDLSINAISILMTKRTIYDFTNDLRASLGENLGYENAWMLFHIKDSKITINYS